MQSHECPQGVVKQPYGNTAYVECELFGGAVCPLVLHCGVVRVLSSCERRCRDPGVVSTEGEENETEPPHLFWGVIGGAVDRTVAVRRHSSSRPRCFSCGRVAEGRSTESTQFDGMPRHGSNL